MRESARESARERVHTGGGGGGGGVEEEEKEKELGGRWARTGAID